MKPKLEIFSTDSLKTFFINLHEFFDINIRGLEDLEASLDLGNNEVIIDGSIMKRALLPMQRMVDFQASGKPRFRN